MLYALSIILSVMSFCCGMVISFTNGMADSQSKMSQWPSWVLLFLAVLLLMLHYLLRGKTIGW